MPSRLRFETLGPRRMLTDFTPIPLADFSPGEASSEFSHFHPTDEELYFNVNAEEFWQTDGTPNGTVKLASVPMRKMFDQELLGPSENGQAVRLFNATADGRAGIWKTDGTAEGTIELIPGQSTNESALDADNYSLVTVSKIASTEVWRVGKTQSDSYPLIELKGHASVFHNAVVIGDIVFLNSSGTLVRTDGTVEGTSTLAEEISHLAGTEEFASFFHFEADGSIQHYRITPHQEEPTFAMTLPVRSRGVHNFGANFMFLQQGDPAEYQESFSTVWISDGTSVGTVPTRHRFEYITTVQRFDNAVVLGTRYGGGLRSDGTQDGTFRPSAPLGWMGDRLVFGSSNDLRGYTVDGETIHPLSLPPLDETPQIPTISPPPVSAFWGIGDDYIKTSRTYLSVDRPEETFVFDANGSLTRVPDDLFRSGDIDAQYVGSDWYVTAELPQKEGPDRRLLTGQHGRIFESMPGESIRFLSSESKPREAPLFFEAEERNARVLWAIDKNANFELVGEFADAASVQTESDFYFSRTTEETGSEVWVTDGTAEGTVPVDIWPGSASSEPQFVEWSGRAIVIANRADVGREMWVIDGSFADTPFEGTQASIGMFDIKEGHDLQLQSVVTSDERDLRFSWDINYDGDFSDATGSNPVVPWEQVNAVVPPEMREQFQPIRVRIEGDGQSFVEAGFLRITNDTPMIHGFNVPPMVRAGEQIEISFNVSDPADQHKLEYSIDLGDGSAVRSGTTEVTHTFDRMGIYDINFKVNDGDGGYAESTFHLTVTHESPTGGGLFEPGQVFGGNHASVDLDVYDGNTDGFLDELVVTQHDARDTIWELDDQGRFSSQYSMYQREVQSNATAFGFFGSDRRIDRVTATNTGLSSGNSWRKGETGLMSEDVALGDLNGDGLLDVFVANSVDQTGRPASDAVFFLDGDLLKPYSYTDGKEFFPSSQTFAAYESTAVELGDVDSDGDLDAVTVSSDAIHVWLNDGHGLFDESPQQIAPGGTDAALGDLDGDDDLDVFVATSDANRVFLNDGTGTFLDSGQRLGSRDTLSLDLGDLDGDRDLDAFVANAKGHADTVWLNDGLAGFEDSGARIAANADSGSVALADLDRDGNLDAIVGTVGAPNHVYVNNSPDKPQLSPGDLNEDGKVDFADFLILAANYEADDAPSREATSSDGDINGDELVNMIDFRILAANYGTGY